MHNYSNNRRQFALLIIIIGVFFGIKPVDAMTLSPVRLEVSGNPGETLRKEITITNEGSNEETYYSSSANFEASGETGTPALVEPKDDIGTWIKTEDESVTLKGGASKNVNFTITIPNNAEPGGHFGALLWGTSPNAPEGGGVSIGAKTATLILLSVSGNVKEEAGLVEFSTKDNKTFYNTLPVSFIYRFRNDGGDRIKPVGKITMRNIVYLPADRIDANPSSGNILPNSTRRFEVNWVKNPRAKDYIAPSGVFTQFFDQAIYQWRNFAIGPYFAKINLLYGTEAVRANESTFFFVFPWQLILLLLVIFIIVWWGGRKLIRRYNRHIIQKARTGMNTPNGLPSHE